MSKDHDGTIDFCAYCGGMLDTGWECNDCGTDWSKMASLHQTFKKLAENQTPLGPEFERILHENLSELYVTDTDLETSKRPSMSIVSDVTAASSLRHYFHMQLMLSDHSDLLVDDWYEKAWGWQPEIGDTFGECFIVLTSGLTGETKKFSIEQVSSILADTLPDEFNV